MVELMVCASPPMCVVCVACVVQTSRTSYNSWCNQEPCSTSPLVKKVQVTTTTTTTPAPHQHPTWYPPLNDQ